MRPLLEVTNLDFSYPSTHEEGGLVLRAERFELSAGTACSLRGTNMSGKTTFVRMVSGHLRGTETVVRVDGETLSPFTPTRARSLGVASVHQHDPLFPELTIWENVMLGRPAGQTGLQRNRTRRGQLGDHLSHWDNTHIDDELRKLSGGAHVLVRMLRAVLWGYKVLLLDEPTIGLDSNVKARFFDLLFSTLNQDRAVVFVSHIDDEHRILANGAARQSIKHRTVFLRAGCFDLTHVGGEQ